MTLVLPAVAQGKRLLMEAAVRLMAHSRSLSSLGLRELAREAGLNPNTFYRHFQSVDELGLAIIEHIAVQLRQPLRDLRRQAAASAMQLPAGPKVLGADINRGRMVCEKTVQLCCHFVAQNPHAFIVGMRELHGASPMLRSALREIMEAFAEDMAEDILELQLVPGVEMAAIRRLASIISRQLFQASLDYLEQDDQRAQISAQSEEMIISLFAGAMLLHNLELLQGNAAAAPLS